MTSPARDGGNDALAALERLLVRHKLVTQEEALALARLITGDPDVVFPPPAPPPAPRAPAPPAPPREAPPEAAPAPPADAPNEGSETP